MITGIYLQSTPYIVCICIQALPIYIGKEYLISTGEFTDVSIYASHR